MSDTEQLWREIEKINRTLERLRTAERSMSAGTSFPTGISAGFLFFRTDLGWLCYYDGTRWLTCHEYVASLPVVTVSTSPVSATYTANRSTYAPYVTQAVIGTNVAATNNASNYWTVNIRGINAGFFVGSIVAGRNTSADTAATFVNTQIAAGSLTTQLPGNYAWWEIQATKTLGTPGNLTVSAQITYRYIVT